MNVRNYSDTVCHCTSFVCGCSASDVTQAGCVAAANASQYWDRDTESYFEQDGCIS